MLSRLRTLLGIQPTTVRRLRYPSTDGLLSVRPKSDHWGWDRGTPVDRYYIERFLAAHAGDVRGNVLEVKDADYTKRYGRDVVRTDVLDIDPANSQATIVADLSTGEGIPESFFDCFILTQTLQYIYDVRGAVAQCERLLRPGGVLLVTVPSLSRIVHGAGLEWDYWRFNHIGKAHCPNGDFRAPDAQYRARSVDAAAGRIVLSLDGDERSARLVNDNIVNVYNEIAVAGALDQFGVPHDRIAAAFDRLNPPTTRFDEEKVGDVGLVRLLTKGLVGVACSRAFQYLTSFSGSKAVVMNIDEVSERTTDVELPAWTYDADYDYLADPTVSQIAVG